MTTKHLYLPEFLDVSVLKSDELKQMYYEEQMTALSKSITMEIMKRPPPGEDAPLDLYNEPVYEVVLKLTAAKVEPDYSPEVVTNMCSELRQLKWDVCIRCFIVGHWTPYTKARNSLKQCPLRKTVLFISRSNKSFDQHIKAMYGEYVEYNECVTATNDTNYFHDYLNQ